MTSPERRLFFTVVFALAGLLSHSTYAGSGDEPHYLAIAHSLAFDFDLDLSNNYGAAEPLIADGKLDPERHAPPGVDGTPRPIHDVGMPLVFAPYVRLARPAAAWTSSHLSPRVMARMRVTPSVLYRHTISAAMIVVAACLSVLMYDVFVRAGSPSRTAFWTAMLVSLSPPLMILGILFFTEVMSATLCLWAFRQVAVDSRRGVLPWALAGVAAGFMLLVHVRNIGTVAALSVLALVGLRSARAAERTGFFLPIAACVAIRTALNHYFWGALVTGPHAHAGEWAGAADTIRITMTRLAGLLIDQEFGLLIYAPVFLLATAGFVVLSRRRPTIARGVGAVVACYVLTIVLPMTNVQGWTGGWSPAARFLAPIVPLLGIALAAAIPVLPRVLVAGLIALQIGIDAYAWQHPKNMWNDGDGVAAVCARGGAAICGYLPSFTARYR